MEGCEEIWSCAGRHHPRLHSVGVEQFEPPEDCVSLAPRRCDTQLSVEQHRKLHQQVRPLLHASPRDGSLQTGLQCMAGHGMAGLFPFTGFAG